MKHILSTILCISISFFSHATIRYVTPGGSGAQNGSSWADAFAGSSLQVAINNSITGDEVWVASGIYIVQGIGRDATFTLKNGVAIYGSLIGTETNITQRSFSNGPSSILSGEIGLPGNSDNAYHVITNSSGLTPSAVIDGFIIRDANDDRPSTTTNGLGGGIYNNGSGPGNFCSPTIRNCVILNNHATFGAGIFNSGYNGGTSSPVISNCVITANTATSGAGIDNFGLQNGNASPAISNCVIYNNIASFNAGGMYCWGGNTGNANPVVVNTVFANNQAINGGGVVSDRLNASSGSSGNSNPTFTNCIFWGNTVTGAGPQFYLLGGATFSATYSIINPTGQSSPHVISGSGTGNISTDPLFLNLTNGTGADGTWMTPDDGLQLSGTVSPAYNTGNNSGTTASDLLSLSRIINGIVDMGAYELNPVTLPVKILSFNAELHQKNQVKLTWFTTSETDNHSFQIQKSADGILYETFGLVNGTGNSNVLRAYDYTDSSPYTGKNFYRLKQLDLSGTFSYSNISFVMSHQGPVTVFPNPATGKIQLSGILPSDVKQIKFVSFSGHVVLTLPDGFTQIDIKSLPKGIYLMNIHTRNGIVTKTVIRN